MKTWGATQTRRAHLNAWAHGAAALATGLSRGAQAEPKEADPSPQSFIARPPEGFVPLSRPGVVAQVEAKGDYASMMQPNLLWPRPEIARRLVERVLMDLTGAPNLTAAMARFVHPADIVAIKVNGIGGQVGHTMAVNFEVILPIVEAIIEVGVSPQNITVYEQYPTFLMGTRVNVRGYRLPEGVNATSHNNRDMVMPREMIFERIPTRFCRQLTDSTALINMSLMKDHSICGFTGALKNITQGSIENPQQHHAHGASPQIAVIYAHPIVQSRARLHITDAFKILYDKGPLDVDPRMRVPHGSVYASTDPVALDAIGYQVIDKERVARGGRTLAAWGRSPTYIERAADRGLGLLEPRYVKLLKTVI